MGCVAGAGLPFCNGHLAVAAVEVEGQAFAVIYQEEGSAWFCVLSDRAKSKFVSDTIFCTHQLDAFSM